MPLVYLKLTAKQLAQLRKGKGVRMNPSKSGDDIYAVDMEPKDYKRYSKAQVNGKGCIVKGTVKHDEESMEDADVEGGKINWKKVGRKIKKGINTVGVDAIEGAKKYIPQEVAKQMLQNGVAAGVLGATTFAGMPNPQLAMAAGKATGSAVDAGYKTDFRKRGALKQFGKNYIEDAKQELMQDAVGAAMSGGKINMKKVKRRVKKLANTIGSDLLEGVKKHVPREEVNRIVRDSVQRGAMYATGDQGLADKLSGYSQNALDAGYNTDFKKRDAMKQMGRQLKDTKKQIIDDAVDYGISQYNGGALSAAEVRRNLDQVIKVNNARNKIISNSGTVKSTVTNESGVPVSRAKFVKGSPEAKAYMASLRAKRKSTGGAGIVKQNVQAIESKIAGKGMIPLGKGMIPLGKGMVPL